jgi:hypothetical protein
VDLDGTLAEQTDDIGDTKIGKAISPMLARVKSWLAAGKKVKIFTARVGPGGFDSKPVAERAIHRWLRAHGLPELEVTATKDHKMTDLYDDRAHRVNRNKGTIVGEGEDAE